MTVRTRTDFRDAALLVAPGIVTACGLYWMSSGRAHGIEFDACVSFLLFVPWQTLGVTVVKCGVDTWILSRGGHWNGRSLRLNRLVAYKYVPLSIAVGLLLLTRLPAFACAVATFTAGVDAVAMVLSNEMSAHARVRAAASANFLKFPLLFLLIGGFSYFGRVGFEFLLLIFACTSVARLIALLLLRPKSRAHDEQPHTMRLATQQVLNYGLFKNDQLATGIVNRANAGNDALFVYLARFPELVSAVLTASAPLLLPRIYGERSRASLIGTISPVGATIGVIVIVGAAIAYGATAASPLEMGIWRLLPAVVSHAILVLPVNYRTYALFRDHRERVLLAGLAKANALGVALAGSSAFFLSGIPPTVLWIIPAQQIVFLWSTRHGHGTTEE